MRNLVLAIAIIVSLPAFADESKDSREALEARSRVVQALKIAANSERCKNIVRTVLQEVEHQDRSVKQHIESGKQESYFWQHAKYAYESSYNHVKNSNCTLGKQ